MPRFGLSEETFDGSDSDSEEEEPSHPLGFEGLSSSPRGKTWISLDPPALSRYTRTKSGRTKYGLDEEEDLFVQSYPPLSSYLSSESAPTAALLRFGTETGPPSSFRYKNSHRRDNDDDLYYSSAEDDDNKSEHDYSSRDHNYGGRSYSDRDDDRFDDENSEIALLFQSPPKLRLTSRQTGSSFVSPEEARRKRRETDRKIQRRVDAERAKIDEECHRTMTILGELVLQSKKDAYLIMEKRKDEEEKLARAQTAKEERERKIREKAEREAALLKEQADKDAADRQRAAQKQIDEKKAKEAAIERKRQELEARARKKTEHVDKAKKLVGQLVQVRASVEPFEKNKAVSKRRLGMKKIAKGKVNTLNDNPMKIQEVATEISQAITRYDQEDAQIKQQLQQKTPGLTPDMAVGRRYFIDLLSATAMTRVQAESFSGTKGDGFPLAAMLAMVSVENKNIVLVLSAHVYTVCPTAIPTLPKPAADASEDDVMIGLGMQRNKKTGDFESFPQFLARTENLVSFMAAVQSSMPSSHQLMGGNTGALLWLKRFLDLLPPAPTSPLPLITAPVLGAFLTSAGHMLANVHEDNFKKLLSKIEADIVNRLDEGEIGKPSAIRLTKVLEDGFEGFRKNLPAKAIKELYYGASEHSQKNDAVTSFGGTIGGQEDVQPKRDSESTPFQQRQQQSNPFGGSTNGFGAGAPAQSPFGNSAAPSPSPFGGNAASTTSAFGGATAPSSSPFGGAAAPSPSPFGGGTAAPSPSPFGGPAAPSPSPFGGTAAPSPSPFGGPAASSPSPFGGATAPSSSPFGGAAAPSPSPFGGVSAPSPSPFGGAAAPSPPPFGGSSMSSSSPFGGAASSSPSPFGGASAPSPSPFGGGASSSSTPFGRGAAPSPSPFGGSAAASPFGGGNAMQQNSPFGGGGNHQQNTSFGGNGKKKGPCKFFARGKCRRGANCQYSHETTNGGFGNQNATFGSSNNKSGGRSNTSFGTSKNILR
eukprot:CAMPEP_0197197722 /NCGR_PEP_ID=MMETSP1423-20130617/33010_1 /TAXON_ID=476441 /ORGANISM="Pseudo-nitzschia heimii, Strain UNC1101" /LENGTH=985 /DNA_ID=CAMNT_0042651547 /DNA_START=44 /DNA_END=3001 /DNA_ORIENTATION=-